MNKTLILPYTVTSNASAPGKGGVGILGGAVGQVRSIIGAFGAPFDLSSNMPTGEDLNDIAATRRALKLAGNKELRISEEDVYLIIGFPRGSKPVQEAKKSDKGEYTRVLDEWKAQWAGALSKTHQVLSQMKNQRQGVDMFKRNFIVYVVTTLVKGQQTWKVNHLVHKSLVDLKEVKDLNWCEFTIDSLISCRDKWKRQPKGAYRGPLLFLMACVQKISRSLKNFARSVIEVVDADTAGPSQTHPGDSNVGHQATPFSQDDGLFASDPLFWDACVELAKTYKKTSGIACPSTFTPPGFDLGFDFRLSQSVQVESPNQGGSGGVGGVGSGGHSSPNPQIERSPNSSSESPVGDSVGDCLPPRKKMSAPHVRSPFFIRHINVLKSLTIREKQVSDWAFLPLDEVHYDR
ncbi:hypothetical protein Cgig2_008931 [Carnegiea gigantea]|uniref:Uncharacterized protein n=1 Tax=Carnegiea gigantea TaxID=171969 RepID=A0A9Q1GN77_9CARY|nr:hypothetical protein Cgig2_008931 [Carnegiea gigantea]